MCREADHGITGTGAGAAALAGGVGVGGRADRYASSGRRVPGQEGGAVAPFTDRLGPLVAPPFEPMPKRLAGVGSGEHGDDRGDAQIGQRIRLRGVVGREVDREPGLDGGEDQPPVLDGDGSVAEDRLVGEGDDGLGGVGGDELVEQLAVDLGAVAGQIAGLGVAPQMAGAERCDFGAEFRPGPAGGTAGYAIPMQAEGAGFGVAAMFVESAAGPA